MSDQEFIGKELDINRIKEVAGAFAVYNKRVRLIS